MQKIIVSRDEAGRRLDKYLMKYFVNAPASFIYKALRKKNIKLSGSKADGSEIVKAGDEIWLFFSDERISELTGHGNAGSRDQNDGKAGINVKNRIAGKSGINVKNEMTGKSGINIKNEINVRSRINGKNDLQKYCRIVYEDASFIAADKLTGVLTQKAAPDDRSLNEALLDYWRSNHGVSETFTPSVCNRLDRNTSGLVIFAGTYPAARAFSEMLRSRAMKKYYIAAVIGRLTAPVHDKAFLTKNERINKVTVGHFDSASASAKAIETAFEPLDNRSLAALGLGSCYGTVFGRQYTLVRVELITGKSHQIRAHLAFLGYPLLGDMKYGDAALAGRLRAEYGIDSQLLHALEIIMPDHVDKPFEYLEARRFCTELPEKFRRLSVRQ